MSFKIVHLVSLFFTFAFGVIGGSVGLNAVLKSGNKLKQLNSKLPQGAIVLVNTQDVLVTGGIVSAFCALIAITALIFILVIIIPSCARVNLSSRTTIFQSTNFLILGLGLFAGLVPYTIFFAQHQAGVTAFLGTLELAPAIIQSVEKFLGVTTVYRDIPYLRLLAILPWITFLFTMIVTGVSFVGLHRHHAAAQASQSLHSDDETEKTTRPEARRGDA